MYYMHALHIIEMIDTFKFVGHYTRLDYFAR